VIAAGYAAKIPRFRVKRPKFEPPFFVIAACYADWTPGVFPKTARKRQIGPNGLLASTARTFSNTCVFAAFCSFRLSMVIGALPAPSLHQNELEGLSCVHFFKIRDFDGFCEKTALRRDWRSSAHLVESLGPHASDPGKPKWLPQAPFKATTNNSAYRGDWRSPGAPITSKLVFYLDGVHISKNLCF
jgi:hypothetical protein